MLLRRASLRVEVVPWRLATPTRKNEQKCQLHSTRANFCLSQLHPWETPQGAARGFWAEEENRMKFVKFAEAKLGITDCSGWYSITASQVHEIGGQGLLSTYFNDSIPYFAQQMYPHHKWIPWMFNKVASGFWGDSKNVRAYLVWLSSRLEFNSPSDWYKLSPKELKDNKGASLLKQYGSCLKIVQVGFPEHEWIEWKFDKASDEFWGDHERVRKYMDSAAEKLGVKSANDWYTVNVSTIKSLQKGSFLVEKFGGSLYAALSFAYPEHQWLEWQFAGKMSPSFWSRVETQRKFTQWISKELKLATMDEWYRVNPDEVVKRGGTGICRIKLTGSTILVNYYGNSLPSMLAAMYPSHKWERWRFEASRTKL